MHAAGRLSGIFDDFFDVFFSDECGAVSELDVVVGVFVDDLVNGLGVPAAEVDDVGGKIRVLRRIAGKDTLCRTPTGVLRVWVAITQDSADPSGVGATLG